MPTDNIQQDKAKLLQLLCSEAYVREKVTLSSGKESDYYIDARRVTLSAEGAYLCARLILEAVAHEDIDAIGGPTLGADPLVGAIAVLSYQRHKPLKTFIIRKAQKTHGRQKQVEGPPLKKGSRAVLIDDVATTGGALLQSLDVLRPMGIRVTKAVCLVDRREGAREALAAQECELVSIFDISQIHK